METRHQIFDSQDQTWKNFLGYYGGGMSLRVGLEEFGAFLNFFFCRIYVAMDTEGILKGVKSVGGVVWRGMVIV